MSSILKPSSVDTRRERAAVWLANKIIATFCTEHYEDTLRIITALGMQELDKMMEEEDCE